MNRLTCVIVGCLLMAVVITASPHERELMERDVSVEATPGEVKEVKELLGKVNTLLDTAIEEAKGAVNGALTNRDLEKRHVGLSVSS